MQELMAVQMNDVVKQGRNKPIGPLNLDIPVGYVVALVGPNGSGKSTLLQFILQTLHPDEGSIRWFGQSYKNTLPLEIRQQISYVAEGPLLEESHMTVQEAAYFRGHWYPAWDQQRFEELLAIFSLQSQAKLNKMSKGERRKFEIAAALAVRPRLLLLDEPSSGLDPFAWTQMMDEIRTCLEGEDVTVIISTHIVDEIKRLADYVVLIHEGKVKGMVEKDAMLSQWVEVWARGQVQLMSPDVRSDVIEIQEDESGMHRFIVQNTPNILAKLAEEGLEVVRSRALELEETLGLWIKEQGPELTH
ncbi:ABC-2 type transport system ATP-binding protein [Paenibacillus shirakamiensis]|uniref:ABC-2 type transport system ATP-binding protein n=1 Tax=Paenibacillus shirakamiensis TaxID=1265935 RepID=A0ABS4JL08_9BACL|nr:ABC transporter ATP-binding protein [Paenibacillus shirakamiensis]MBP2001656.1 ABC-2 type transport system ATP-binding protein [Paenibacillus shirakamiensis]